MWLLILSRLLLVYQPISLALAASRALNSLPVRGFPLTIGIALRVVVAGFGVAAGMALTNRRAGAIALAKVALVLSAALDLLIYGETTPYFPSNLPPGDAPVYLAASLVYHTAWLGYLFRSKSAL